jgi:hypothetical protein
MTPNTVKRLANQICELEPLIWDKREQIESLLREAMEEHAAEVIESGDVAIMLKERERAAYTRAAEVARSCCPKSGSYRSLGEDIAAAIERLREDK